MGERGLCVDIGSTFTKGLLVDIGDGSIRARAEVPTPRGGDVLDALAALRQRLGADDTDPAFVCSSAGGGLRLAVVGYEPTVTALAGQRVGLSAGARVVHVSGGRLDRDELSRLRGARPDIILLVGGTDGGNADVLLHNAGRLGDSRLAVPVVLAGNVEARDEAAALLNPAKRRILVADNVLPQIGAIDPESARAAIRAAFLEHVIGGKHLSTSPDFARLVRCATPEAVLRGVEVLGGRGSGDAMLIDIGGATTDVYSTVDPSGENAHQPKQVSPELRYARTVEADLGMRWSAEGVLEAADREHLAVGAATRRHAARVAHHVGALPTTGAAWRADLALATTAAVVAARRHGRPVAPGERPRSLADVGILIGSGGVLRYAEDPATDAVLAAVLGDHGGGWLVPRHARTTVDRDYVVFAIGLLADAFPEAAGGLADHLLA